MIASLIGDFSVSIQIDDPKGIQWWFLGIYGPNKFSMKNQFWDELAGLGTVCWRNWCLGGDFNVVHMLLRSLIAIVTQVV